MPRPRIGDVAERAGVSKTSVSFAFNQPERLNDATRSRILAAAEELGYRPSPIARRLAARSTRQIGLVVPQPTHDVFANPFVPELMRGMADVCDDQGIALVIVPPVRGSIGSAIEEALVDGLVLLGLADDHPELAQVRRSGVPIVALDVERWDGASVIAIDDSGGARQAAEHLHTLGHRDVGAVAIAEHPDSSVDAQHGISGRRIDGMRVGLDRASLRVVSADASEEGGRAAFQLFHEGGLPTAVMTMSDITAIGIMNAAIDAGLRLPDDLSVIGFDDIPAATWVCPRLTTVRQPIREKGRLAATLLIRAISSPDGRPPTSALLPTRLIVRESTAPLTHHATLTPSGFGGGATAE